MVGCGICSHCSSHKGAASPPYMRRSERALLERIDPDVLAVEYGGARDVMFGAFPKMSAKDAACSMQSLEAGSNQNAWGDFLRTLKSP